MTFAFLEYLWWYDWHMMRSHIKQTFQVFYHWSIMGTRRFPLMMNLDLLCSIFGIIWHRIILTCTSDRTLMSNVSLLHEWKWRSEVRITYNTSILNVSSLSRCSLSFQNSWDAILHWNLIPIITFPFPHHMEMESVARGEVQCPACVIPSLIHLWKWAVCGNVAQHQPQWRRSCKTSLNAHRLMKTVMFSSALT